MKGMKYLVYILMTKDAEYYMDMTTKSLMEVFSDHINNKFEKTKNKFPCFIVYEKYFSDKEEALKFLKNLKKTNKKRRLDLIKSGLNNYIHGVGKADRVQILLHKEHGINGIRYMKDNPIVDYHRCLNPDCPKHCNNDFILVDKNHLTIEEIMTKNTEIKIKKYSKESESGEILS